MRILLLNPNTTEAVTDRLLAVGKTAMAAGTDLIPLTAPRGVPYIATRAEAQIGGAIALEMLAEHHTTVDAAVIAAFGDPGLMGARELFDIPVVGMAEAAMLAACMAGRRFAIVTFATALGPWFQECVEMHGMTARCAGIRMLDGGFKAISDVQEEKEELLVEKDKLSKMWVLRRILMQMGTIDAMEFLLDKMKDSKTNEDFFANMNQ